jgi:hypothetical protein
MKNLKPLIRLKILSKHSHQTHAFHKSLTSQKMLKTPTTNNKAPLNCTRTLVTFNSTPTYNKTSPTSNQTHISHKFFLPLSKHFDEQQQSFDNLQQHSYPQQNNLNIFAKVTASTHLEHLSQNAQNSKISCNKVLTSYNKTQQNSFELQPNFEELQQNFDKLEQSLH